MYLEGYHEDPDTRNILHSINPEEETMIVSVRDIDALVLLIVNFNKIRYIEF